jgi:hypothetical protein
MISKKAAAFLETPPGEGGGGGGKGERRGGGSPELHAPGAKRNGGSLGIPLRSGAKRRTLAPAGGSSPLYKLPRRGGYATIPDRSLFRPYMGRKAQIGTTQRNCQPSSIIMR